MRRSFLLLLATLLVVTVLCVLTDADIRATSYFYRPGAGFPIGRQQPWWFLCRFGEWPAFIMAGLAALLLLAGLFRPALARFRRQALFLVLLMIIARSSGQQPGQGSLGPSQPTGSGSVWRHHGLSSTLAAGAGAKERLIPGRPPDRSLLSVSPVFYPASKKASTGPALALGRLWLWLCHGCGADHPGGAFPVRCGLERRVRVPDSNAAGSFGLLLRGSA